MASPRQGSSFSGSSKGLDARRLEDNLFGVTVQVNEQVSEQIFFCEQPMFSLFEYKYSSIICYFVNRLPSFSNEDFFTRL